MTGGRVLMCKLAVLVVALAGARNAYAADSIQVGDVITDSPTICCLGFSVPIAGDDDYDAVASIEYRLTGTSSWVQGLPLLRVRPELTSEETTPGYYGLPVPEEQFAGSLFRLAANTNYEIRITITDPDGGDRVQTLSATTRSVPRSEPAVPRVRCCGQHRRIEQCDHRSAGG